nr:MAG TPA: hypothetical protein [Caudoviricetes sp.]
MSMFLSSFPQKILSNAGDRQKDGIASAHNDVIHQYQQRPALALAPL